MNKTNHTTLQKSGLPSKYDCKRGEDNWVGRHVVKNFGELGDFEVIVYGVDEDTNNKDYRLFLVHYPNKCHRMLIYINRIQ